MSETARQKNIRRTLEATVYRIEKAFGKTLGVYRISKRVIDVEVDSYHASIKKDPATGQLEYWCDCPGFRMQKYPQWEHKHIRMALDYRQVLGEPEYADYKFTGSGRHTTIRHNGRKI